MRGVASALGLLALASGCQSESFFACKTHDDCASAEAGGICEPIGACSFPDVTCESGRRYGEQSDPAVAGQCVGADGTSGSSGPSSTTAPLPSTSEASDETTSTGPQPLTGTSSDGTTTTELTSGSSCDGDWWDCAWAVRHRITFVEQPAATLHDVPVLVLLQPDHIDYEVIQADAEDLRFVTDDAVVLPFEIELWDPTGVSVVWVGLDAFSEDTSGLWLYYGNPVAELAHPATEVWPEPFAGVWHMDEERRDSTAFGNHAVAVDAAMAVPGRIHDGHTFPTVDSTVDVATDDALTDLFLDGGTVSAWIRPDGWGGAGYGRIAHKSAGWYFSISTGGQLNFVQVYSVDADVMWSTPLDTIPLGAWSHVAVSFVASSTEPARLFVDGMEVVQDNPLPALGVAPVSDAPAAINIGNSAAHLRQFEGIIDEVRVERTVRSPEWIRIQDISERDGLLQLGPAEAR